MSNLISRSDLLSLEQYHEQRESYKKNAIARRKQLRFHLNDHLIFCFEDKITIRYQIQEIIRAEKLYKPEDIQAEIDVYNPLISDENNLKATLMIAYEPEHRDAALHELVGIEHSFWIQVENGRKIAVIANEDLPRSTDKKTSAVHFIRFPLLHEEMQKICMGAQCFMGCDHDKMQIKKEIPVELTQNIIQLT